MAYRNLLIENKAYIKCQNNQLLIITDTNHSVPVEDINSIVLENLHSTITTDALSKLAQSDVAVYICNQKHLPCAVLTPFAQHSRNTAIMKLQTSLSTPTRKRLWQQIVRSKINNQAICLSLLDENNASKYLNYLSRTVASGDVNNVEATAANYYFKILFEPDFSRKNEADQRNSALNYGYSIIRGHIARLLTSYGFIPMNGIHHDNEQNSFNLADDFIEPFRPVVDLFTARNITYDTYLRPEIKRQLYNLLNMNIKSDKQIHSVAYSAEKMIQSFTRCCKQESTELCLPILMDLKQHTYE